MALAEEFKGERKRLPEKQLFGIRIPSLPAPEIPLTFPELAIHLTIGSYPLEEVRFTLQSQADQTARATETLAGMPANSLTLHVIEPPAIIQADLSVACFPLAKPLKSSPVAIAQTFATNFNQGEPVQHVQNVRAEGAYLNFDLDPQSIGAAIVQDVEEKGDRYGEINLGNGARVVIDLSAPNIAKYMSVGHLRSTCIGNSLVQIYRAGGYEVIGDNHIGDWGTQFGMLGRAVELWGQEIPEMTNGTNPVNGLYQLYVRMHDEIAKEKDQHSIAHPHDKTPFQTPLEIEGREWFKRLESGDTSALALLKWATTISHTEFKRVYELLGVKFEYQLGESAYVPMVDDVNAALINRGVGEYDERGGLVVKFPKEKKLGDRLVVKKSDGTSLYATRDIATLAARSAWFDPEKILYVVGGEQQDYFKQLFETYRRLSDGKAPDMEHVYFGMMKLPEGKMSTRKGRVVFLEDVLKEAISRARVKVEENNPDFPPKEIDKIAQQVGVGAVIYMDLGQGRERDIQFDWDKALSFQGNSGPYLQYAHARASSILRRAKDSGIEIDPEAPLSFDHPSEQLLAKQLGKMPQAVVKAIEENQPNRVASFTFATADSFSSFYNQSRVLDEPDPDKRNSRLRLTAATAQVLKNGLHLLGMEAPEKM